MAWKVKIRYVLGGPERRAEVARIMAQHLLKKGYKNNMVIDRFTGKHRFLSNSYPSPIRRDGFVYPSVEHAYQAAKTEELSLKAFISTLDSAAFAQRVGGKITPGDDWMRKKRTVMSELIRQKFENPRLRFRLLATHDAVIVENENDLGAILMETRQLLMDTHEDAYSESV